MSDLNSTNTERICREWVQLWDIHKNSFFILLAQFGKSAFPCPSFAFTQSLFSGFGVCLGLSCCASFLQVIALQALRQPKSTKRIHKAVVFWNFLSYPSLYTSWLSRLRQRQVDSCIRTWPASNRTLHCGALKFWSSEVGEINGFFPGYPCDIIYDIS